MEDKKLTICFIGTAESVHMLKWAKYFSERGHNVHLISYKVPVAKYDIGRVNLYLIKKKFPIQIWPLNTILNLPFTLIRVKKLIKEIKPDIINGHYITSYGTLAALLGFHPLVNTAWGSDILVTPKKFLPCKWSVKYALKKADLITCDAEHMKKAMIKFGVKEEKIKIINFGIDTKKFTPGPKNEELKEKLGVSKKKIVISLRSLYPICDVETLIKAIPLVLSHFPKTIFIIAGEGFQKDELKNLAEELNVSGNIKFTGFIPNEELLNYLRAADVYVSTALSDGGISASTAESMACGLPVVITNVADNKKWVIDGENGFLIPAKSPQILAEKIIDLLKNEDKGKKFGAKARETIEEKNDYYKEMAKMEEIYKNLALSKP